MSDQEIVLSGVTRIDIQDIFRQTLKALGKQLPQNVICFFDTSYLYTFDRSDIGYIRKYTDSLRLAQTRGPRAKNPKQFEWHMLLERWYQGQTVNIFERTIKPTQIQRTMDRVVNELMDLVAQGMANTFDIAAMKFNAIGDGSIAGASPLPGDTALDNEIDRINVVEDVGGGAITVDGSTFMNVGNHSIDVATANFTEVGIFNADKPGTGGEEVATSDDQMGDHSIFGTAVEHVQGEDAPGATVIIYMCSS